ncbi:MAG: ABC transporter ATP-binding protein [Acidobacteriota bacterium]
MPEPELPSLAENDAAEAGANETRAKESGADEAGAEPVVAPPALAEPVPAAPVPAAPVLELRGLVKRYGSVEALSGLDLTVRRGEVYGFLGRNGAGKSTTIRSIMGITKPTAGTIELFGQTASGPAPRQRIGYVAQEQNFYGWMTPTSIGRFVRGFYPRWDDATYRELIHDLDLPTNRKVRTFSGGMKVKLALALALAHHPELLVLDEPTAGLDPVARHEFLEMVREQAEGSGRTTFFSTHLIDEIELAAHRVGIVDGGRTLYEGSVRELAARLRRLRCRNLADGAGLVLAAPLPALLNDPQLGWRVIRDQVRDGERHVIVETGGRPASAGELDLGDWVLEEMPLEQSFIEMVRKPLKRSGASSQR